MGVQETHCQILVKHGNVFEFGPPNIDLKKARVKSVTVRNLGGFQMIDLIITELKDQMTCYEFECSLIGGKFISKKRNPLQDLLSSLNVRI